MRTIPLFLVATSLTLAAALSAVAQNVPDMGVLDPAQDGSVDLDEARRAATAMWTALNPDGDETLETDELIGRLENDEFAAANPDGDQTIEQDEWMTLIDTRFAAADANTDNTVSAEEFGTEAGQRLLRLLQ